MSWQLGGYLSLSTDDFAALCDFSKKRKKQKIGPRSVKRKMFSSALTNPQ